MSTREQGSGWSQYLALDDEALFAQCEFDRFRASGPGGQKRNVTDSAVRLRHRPSGLSAEANEARSQHENRARALRRLRTALALQLRKPVDLARYEPPPLLVSAVARPHGRREAGRLEALALAFDLLEACGWRLGEAAKRLGVSSAALGRLLSADDEVWRAVAERRQALGMAALQRGR